MVEKHYKDKAALVEQLRDELTRASAVVVAEYRGLKAGDLVKLRTGLRDSQVTVRVVKNSLLRRAAEGMPLAEMLGDLAGPTAVAFGFGEATDAAKALDKSASSMEAFNLKSGYIEKMVLDSNGITAIAKLPGKTEMHSQFAGAMEGFVGEFVFCVDAVIREFHGLLEAKSDAMA